jgi:hypothetical protein
MTEPQLLEIVEVDKEDRVLCQARGCKHPVFKRIHVVEVDGKITVLGSECFKQLYGYLNVQASTPRYGAPGGRKLTDAERQMLIGNTRQLVEMWAAAWQERQEEIQRQVLERKQEVQRQGPQKEEDNRRLDLDRQRHAARPIGPPNRRLPYHRWLEYLTPEQRKHFEAVRHEVKKVWRATWGTDPDLPGFVGSINADARLKFEEMAKGHEGA